MKDLTIEQLQEQKNAINATRFLMERNYNASEETISELMSVIKELDQEIANRICG